MNQNMKYFVRLLLSKLLLILPLAGEGIPIAVFDRVQIPRIPPQEQSFLPNGGITLGIVAHLNPVSGRFSFLGTAFREEECFPEFWFTASHVIPSPTQAPVFVVYFKQAQLKVDRVNLTHRNDERDIAILRTTKKREALPEKTRATESTLVGTPQGHYFLVWRRDSNHFRPYLSGTGVSGLTIGTARRPLEDAYTGGASGSPLLSVNDEGGSEISGILTGRILQTKTNVVDQILTAPFSLSEFSSYPALHEVHELTAPTSAPLQWFSEIKEKLSLSFEDEEESPATEISRHLATSVPESASTDWTLHLSAPDCFWESNPIIRIRQPDHQRTLLWSKLAKGRERIVLTMRPGIVLVSISLDRRTWADATSMTLEIRFNPSAEQ